MNVLMLTNTFTPHVGGVARSVQSLTDGLREQGHRVLVVAPVFANSPPGERDVYRVPTLQHFRGSDFSVPLPAGPGLMRAVREMSPDIIHSHHPFLLGDTALRAAASCQVPAVFTYHTRYEHYSHYAPVDSPRLKRLALELAIGYCNLCDAVVAPSDSIAEFLHHHDVAPRTQVIPSGIRQEHFMTADGQAARRQMGIPREVFVIGHVGRLAPEKNLDFLAAAMAQYLVEDGHAHCLIAGEGAMREAVVATFAGHGVEDRLHLAGVLDRGSLANAYRAMNVFAFSSHSETQGLVLAEAMAAGTPVVAIDAAGVREVVRDGINGRLLMQEDRASFVAALGWIAGLGHHQTESMRQAAIDTAMEFSLPRTVARMLGLYHALLADRPVDKDLSTSQWASTRRSLGEEWKLLRNLAHAVSDAVLMPRTGD